MHRLHRGALAALVFFVGLLAACSRGPAGGPIVITAVPNAESGNALVRVTGLSGSELQSLRGATFDDAEWAELLRVSVTDNDVAAMAGRYVINDTSLEFTPRFPFERGRRYQVRLDPARLPRPRREAATISHIELPRTVSAPSTNVTSIDPSSEVWPENMLRFYVHFSAPMSRGQGTKYVHLVDHKGDEIPDAILAAYSDLWNDDATRLTVFFDPGRVKRGIGPNVKMGRAIVAGLGYAIKVDAAWPDANGQPLTAPFSKPFTAGPPAYKALDTKDWRVTAPKAGTRDAVTVRFPSMLDRALLDRAIGIRGADGHVVAGAIAVSQAETIWQFTPNAPWAAGDYQLVVLTLLEDPAGNKIGRAFEVLSPEQPTDEPATPETATVGVSIR